MMTLLYRGMETFIIYRTTNILTGQFLYRRCIRVQPSDPRYITGELIPVDRGQKNTVTRGKAKDTLV